MKDDKDKVKKDSQDIDELTGMRKELLEFGYLINTILDYYSDGKPVTESGESWKKGTNLEVDIIPKEIDDMVIQAFKKQLSKFV